MRHGTRQDQRLPPALREGYVLPDEFDLSQRLRMSLLDAAGMTFTGAASGEHTHWSELLQQDEAFLLADCAAMPLAAQQQAFLAELEWATEAELWATVRTFAVRVDGWRQCLAVAESSAARLVGQTLVELLCKGVGALLAHAQSVCAGNATPPLRLRWLDTASDTAKRLAQRPPATSSARRQLLRRTWLALAHAVEGLQPRAVQALQGSLDSGRHGPAAALLVAGVQLFHYTRAPLNAFPDRLVEFYLQRVLHLRGRGARPESLHLRLDRLPGFDGPVRIAPGQRFLAGKDGDGQAVVFAADYGLDVRPLRVCALHTLRVERDALISPEHELDCATRLKAQTLPLAAPGTPDPPTWPLLGGASRMGLAEHHEARIGLAVASPLLRLGEGRREIRLLLQLAHPAEADPALAARLRQPADTRSSEWLAEVFAAYARIEADHHPPRPRSEPPPPLDPAALSEAAWARGSEFERDVELAFLAAAALACTRADIFAERLGRLFAAWLAARDENLRRVDLDALRALATRLLPDTAGREVALDDPLILIHPPRAQAFRDALPNRELIFSRVFAGCWQAQLSTESGWFDAVDLYLQRATPGSDDSPFAGALELTLALGPDQPAIVPCTPQLHGSQWPAQPVLQLQLRSRTRMYACSLLQQFALRALDLEVSVRGLREMVLYNHLGRLDPSKPFQPFGPTPTQGAYLVLGSNELVCKPLQNLSLQITWLGLPRDRDGMAAHYRGYPGNWGNEVFRLQPQVLLDGQWRSASPDVPAFATAPGRDRLLAQQAWETPGAVLRRLHRPAPLPPGAGPALYGLDSRNGFFRFALVDPPEAFGHALYPRLLTEALSRQAREKRHTQPLPCEPYTPTLETATLSYRSAQPLPLDAPTDRDPAADPLAPSVFHLYPFGIQRVGMRGQAPPFLLPRFDHDGQLYIGLQGEDPQGLLSLFFQLHREDAAERWLEPAPRLHWAVWCHGSWRELDRRRQLADDTLGLLRPGIVQLDLPADMARGCPQLPGDCYWLRLGADWGFDQLAGLHAVHAQAVRATRVLRPDADDGLLTLPPGSVRGPEQPVPGLAATLQLDVSEGGYPADRPESLRLRAAERLRHKQRAVTAWDYERLLLDAFPEAVQAKCFPHHEARLGDDHGLGQATMAERAGQVLVVVVPAPRQGAVFDATQAPRLDAATLAAMQAHLQARAPAGSQVLVRNAAFERLQVRCALTLAPGVHTGAALRALNRRLVEYLSPWRPGGLGPDFDWEVCANELEALLRAQAEVAQVGPLSLLHIVSNDSRFHALRDTASDTASEVADANARRVRPIQPWSLVLPTPSHLLEPCEAAGAEAAARVTGIQQLQIGNTFIVGRQPPAANGAPP